MSLTRLTCTHCGAEEYTCAPSYFRGDLCMECGEGHMIDRPAQKLTIVLADEELTL